MVADEMVALRRQILALKDEVFALLPEVAGHDPDAGRSLMRARAALFEAWTLLVGPPEEEDEDH